MTALEIVNILRDAGARLRVSDDGSIFVIGHIPAELADELAAREGDVLSLLQEHGRRASMFDVAVAAHEILRVPGGDGLAVTHGPM